MREGRGRTGVSDIPGAAEETGQKWRQEETRKRLRETRAKHVREIDISRVPGQRERIAAGAISTIEPGQDRLLEP